MRILTYGVPLTLVTVYRMVPDRVRGSRVWPGHKGPSSSLLAVGLMRDGVNGWVSIGYALQVNGEGWV